MSAALLVASWRARMRKDDGVTGLQANQRFEDRGRGRVE